MEFKRGQNVGACLAGTSVTSTATLYGVLRATVSRVMSTEEKSHTTGVTT